MIGVDYVGTVQVWHHSYRKRSRTLRVPLRHLFSTDFIGHAGQRLYIQSLCAGQRCLALLLPSSGGLVQTMAGNRDDNNEH